MAFVSSKKSKKTNNLPSHEVVVKVSTSKGFVTLGRIGLFEESSLHSKVAQLTNEQLIKLFAKAELSIVEYSRDNNEGSIELDL